MENKILKSEIVTRFWNIKDCMFTDYSENSLFSRNFKRDLVLIPAHKIGKVEIAEQLIYRYAEIQNSEISAKEHLDIELCNEEAK
jgi:hypothetical protein